MPACPPDKGGRQKGLLIQKGSFQLMHWKFFYFPKQMFDAFFFVNLISNLLWLCKIQLYLTFFEKKHLKNCVTYWIRELNKTWGQKIFYSYSIWKGLHLASNSNGFEEVGFSSWVNNLLAWVVPVKVHDGLLQPQQVVDGADDQVDGGCVASLGTQVVLPICGKNKPSPCLNMHWNYNLSS